MALARTIVRNIFSSWAGYAVQMIVGFLLTPFILHTLGETRYGVWTLAVGLTGYYGILDLGISAGIGQYLARYLAAGDYDRLNKTASTGFATLSACGAVVFLCSIVVALNSSRMFNIPQQLRNEVVLVIIVTAASVALQMAFFTYSAVFTALQRFDLSNTIGIGTRLVSATATIMSLRLGYGLVGLSVALALSNLLDYLIRWRIARRLVPAMKISMRLFARKHLAEVATFGGWNLAIAGSVRLISYTDTLVIATFMPISAVAPFGIAASMRSYFEDVFIRAGYVFYPAATKLDAEGDRSGLQSLYLVSSKFMFLASVWCGIVALCWAPEFFRLWIGERSAESDGNASIPLIFCLLLLGSMVSVGQRIGIQVLAGIRQVRLLAILLGVEGLSNLVISLILVRRLGLVGVALGTLIPAIVFQGIVQPIYLCRALEIQFGAYCRSVLLRPALAFLAILPAIPIAISFERLTGWSMLLAYVTTTAVVTFPIVLFIGLTRSERILLFAKLTAVRTRFVPFGRSRSVLDISHDKGLEGQPPE